MKPIQLTARQAGLIVGSLAYLASVDPRLVDELDAIESTLKEALGVDDPRLRDRFIADYLVSLSSVVGADAVAETLDEGTDFSGPHHGILR